MAIPPTVATERSAVLSACRRYRYALERRWGGGPSVVFVGLNPSVADETQDDPTVRRCIGFARSWGFEALTLVNLFGYRATQPAELRGVDDPVGPLNNELLRQRAGAAAVVVAAWGTHGAYLGRDRTVCALLPGLQVLRLTRQGHPAHPLYLPKGLRPQPWQAGKGL